MNNLEGATVAKPKYSGRQFVCKGKRVKVKGKTVPRVFCAIATKATKASKKAKGGKKAALTGNCRTVKSPCRGGVSGTIQLCKNTTGQWRFKKGTKHCGNGPQPDSGFWVEGLGGTRRRRRRSRG